jgi:hypothetical protein
MEEEESSVMNDSAQPKHSRIVANNKSTRQANGHTTQSTTSSTSVLYNNFPLPNHDPSQFAVLAKVCWKKKRYQFSTLFSIRHEATIHVLPNINSSTTPMSN